MVNRETGVAKLQVVETATYPDLGEKVMYVILMEYLIICNMLKEMNDATYSENSTQYVDALTIEYKLNGWCTKEDANLFNVGYDTNGLRKVRVFGCGLSEELINLLNCHTR